jgi:hypothetical protein
VDVDRQLRPITGGQVLVAVRFDLLVVDRGVRRRRAPGQHGQRFRARPAGDFEQVVLAWRDFAEEDAAEAVGALRLDDVARSVGERHLGARRDPGRVDLFDRAVSVEGGRRSRGARPDRHEEEKEQGKNERRQSHRAPPSPPSKSSRSSHRGGISTTNSVVETQNCVEVRLCGPARPRPRGARPSSSCPSSPSP